MSEKPKRVPGWAMFVCLMSGLSTMWLLAPYRYVAGFVALAIGVTYFVQEIRFARWVIEASRDM